MALNQPGSLPWLSWYDSKKHIFMNCCSPMWAESNPVSNAPMTKMGRRRLRESPCVNHFFGVPPSLESPENPHAFYPGVLRSLGRLWT